jgi:hypothetical protein
MGDFIKALLGDEEFSLREFLDVVIMRYASQSLSADPQRAFWHKLLRLRRTVEITPVNPRIQLENLLL